MALSDDERKRLEKLERDLAAADPQLNSKLQSGFLHDVAARTVYGVLAILAGLTVVVLGIRTQAPIVGGAGFLLMVLGANWTLTGFQRHHGI